MKAKLRSNLLLGLGLLLILAAAALTAYNLHTEQTAGETATEAMVTLSEQVTENVAHQIAEAVPDYVLYPEMPMPEVNINGINYIGYLAIPALGLDLPIVTTTSNYYLRAAPCRFSGSAYTEDLVIGAHNYVTHFGRLKELNYGDELTFTDMDGNEFRYVVDSVEILQPHEAEYLTESEYPLSLYTCTIGGRTRLTIRCIAAERNA